MRRLLLTMSLFVICSMALAILIHSEDFSTLELPAGWQSETTGEYPNCCRVSQSDWLAVLQMKSAFILPAQMDLQASLPCRSMSKTAAP